jgi:hypothetical protein
MESEQPPSFLAAFPFFFAWRGKAFGIWDFKFLAQQ